MNKLTWVVVAIIVIAGGWWLLSNSQQGPTETGPIKIGVIGPYTGDAAAYGEPMRNTVQLAVDEINAAGGVRGRLIEIIFEDGKCDSTAAVSAAQKLINADGVKAVIGGFCSGETIPVVPIAESAKMVLLSPSASSPLLTNAGPHFFRDYPSDSAQGKVLAEIAYNTKQWKKVAFIQEQTDYAKGVFDAFEAAFKPLGGTTVNQAFPSTTNDFRSLLTKLKAENPDALFVDTQAPAAAQRILKQAGELGWKPNIILNDVGGGDKETVSTYASQLEGAITAEFVPNENNPKLQKLVADYKARYNEDLPYHGYMSTTYDAVYLLAEGIKVVGYDGEKLAAWSRTIRNWDGASGSITIGSDGDRVSGHTAEEIKGGKTQLLAR
ncbi:hypothetical protein A3A39_01190 [Candidatus Kaiserbacteria bacterium RIFCSPLOWO2_01_FULL_54_13]|uniref:Leucine-binding protein domain-containing protein n=1 Tax=Candidatus Kaiserbacteria bacterium RIFCSPLOWO2_01_FULL_54_13 TaxID=1798512 RepID=A0A1F6F285_9BACT|nr:MAG: hypothetical protein A3A39_01190 [Candidatus Kaiserbacteria bacterium RIFCSPLOWO2_01_FULL_54_13]